MSFENDKKLLQDVVEYAGGRSNMSEKECLEIIRNMPMLKRHNEWEHHNTPWKAHWYIDREEMMPTTANEKVHPVLKEFFDVTVRENMTVYDEMLPSFKEMVAKGRCHFLEDSFYQWDGNDEITKWLKEYAKTAFFLEKQGKEIFVPETFTEYPCLKQFVDEEIEYVKFNELCENTNVLKDSNQTGYGVLTKDGKTINVSQDGNVELLASILINIKDEKKYNSYVKILEENNLKENVFNSNLFMVAKEKEKLQEPLRHLEKEKHQLSEKQQQFQRYVDHKSAEIKAKSYKIAFIKDIDDLYNKGADEFDTNRQKELFDKMKDEMIINQNLREGYLACMCKIYASAKNTPEQKAEYFEQLHKIRKSGKTNAEKREMAHAFGRVLERNPELAKDEALKGLAKVDYSAIGYTPTKRGFSKNDGGRTEK